MQLFKLHTNEGERLVYSTKDRLRAKMFEYIRHKRANGYELSEIVFCWSPIFPGTICGGGGVSPLHPAILGGRGASLVPHRAPIYVYIRAGEGGRGRARAHFES